MKTLKSYVAAAAAIIALGLGSAATLASILVAPSLTGHVTSISGVSSVTIDGRLFIIRTGSAAMTQVAQLQVGQVVDVYLDGPATTSASEVVGINLHSGS